MLLSEYIHPIAQEISKAAYDLCQSQGFDNIHDVLCPNGSVSGKRAFFEADFNQSIAEFRGKGRE